MIAALTIACLIALGCIYWLALIVGRLGERIEALEKPITLKVNRDLAEQRFR